MKYFSMLLSGLLFSSSGLLVSSMSVAAADFPLTGTFTLEAVHSEVIGTNQRDTPFGEHPEGVLVFTPEGRMIGIIVPPNAADGTPPKNLVAYSGLSTSEGPGKVTYHVDISINPKQKGTSTTRTYTLVGDKLTLITIPAKGPDGQMTRTVLEWRRSK